MKTKLSPAQIEQAKGISNGEAIIGRTLKGNNIKKIGYLPINVYREICSKKIARIEKTFEDQPLTPAAKVRQLIERAKQYAGTNYQKILIEGNTGIYLAHPVYQHLDYNKSRIFDKNATTLKLMAIYNTIVTR
jgi:hypothetical protein